jgi:flavin-dependent dehydrogenase
VQLVPQQTFEIIGAGPAGLAAALTIAKAGGKAVVYERCDDVGSRFHGDLQGIENWTTERDVLDELNELGVEPSFQHWPCREVLGFDPDGRECLYRSPQPIFYLVRRGSVVGSLDQSLKAQALAAGVEIRFGQSRVPAQGAAIVACGPRITPVVASGLVFETDMADGAYVAVSNRLAPSGYAYLMIRGGKGTVAACLFARFEQAKACLARTLEFFRAKVGLVLTNAREFGGYGNVRWPPQARSGRLLHVGEAAGFQDPLWGFGMRYAMVSGHLAARALLAGSPKLYDQLWRERLASHMRAALVNRFFYSKMNDRGFRALMRRFGRGPDIRPSLRRHYGHRLWKDLLAFFLRTSEIASGPPSEPAQ